MIFSFREIQRLPLDGLAALSHARADAFANWRKGGPDVLKTEGRAHALDSAPQFPLAPFACAASRTWTIAVASA
jgi:hypothetical protein